MITLHLLQLLEDNGYGVINDSLFENLIPSGKTGVSIVSVSGNTGLGRRNSSITVDLYSRGENNIDGHDKLDRIRLFFSDKYGELCKLPKLKGLSDIEYSNVTVTNIGNVDTLPPDENNRNLYRLSLTIKYQDNRKEEGV